MQSTVTCLLLWALVVHALVNGDHQDAVLDVYDTKQQCHNVRESQHVAGDCYEVSSVIHSNAT
ncbi:TPA: DUF1482 family protein [Enterobacter ludwigii]|nr:DUF1482 family protein [Enterobacter ludwigii]HDR2597921.1 DUF1482 family protein [Enterobacter ludwigii]